MPLRFAFAGFRHGHILEVYAKAGSTPGCEVAGACEEHPATRANLESKVKFTHANVEALLNESNADVLAIGDYFGRRGALALMALERGKHVLSDKPLCTSLAELDEIERVAREKKRVVACQLGMPYQPQYVKLRELIQTGKLGVLHQISFGGQHPLLYGQRPGWYYEAGKHGGTINDIAIHSFDMLPKVTGLGFKRVIAARTWNAFAKEEPQFMDSAQFMLELSNGCGVLGDVSYALPTGLSYQTPQYWRFTLYGSLGIAEVSANSKQVWFAGATDAKPQIIESASAPSGGYFDTFLAAVNGSGNAEQITQETIQATRVSLRVQKAADLQEYDVKL